MFTYKQLKEVTEKCQVKFELSPRYADRGYYNMDGKYVQPQIGWWLGLNNISGRSGQSEWQWVWFTCLDDNLTDESKFFFDQRYSMAVGQVYRGWREGFRAFKTIEKRLGN